MKDDYFKNNYIYKIDNNRENIINNIEDKYINKIENFGFYEQNIIYDKYSNMSDKDLDLLISNALISNRARIAVPSSTPTPPLPVIPTPTQTPITIPIPTPTAPMQPLPVIPTPAQTPTTIPTPSPVLPDTPKDTSDLHPMIKKFLDDTTSVSVANDFRGWVLPNGQLVSQYNDNGAYGRQDHGALVKLFINGLQEHDRDKYDEMMAVYNVYVSKNHNAYDVYESFAVDALGWMQVSEFGSKRIIARQENWQNRLLAPFIVDFGFDLVSSDNPNQGVCYNSRFFRLYDSIKEIITYGLEKKYSSSISM